MVDGTTMVGAIERESLHHQAGSQRQKGANLVLFIKALS
jgi:hypothetical protein